MREKIYLLTFSADLQALCTPATKLFLNTSSLIQRNKIKSLSEYAFNFLHISYKQTKNPFTYTKEFRGTLTTKILTFYKSFTNEERTPLTFYADSEALWANIFSLLLQAKKKAPHFTRDFRSTLTTLKSFFLQIVYIRTHTRLKEGSLENFRI